MYRWRNWNTSTVGTAVSSEPAQNIPKLLLRSPDISPNSPTARTPRQITAAIIPNADLRAKFIAARADLVSTVNVLGFTAAYAAYRDGGPWLDELMRYLETNRDFVMDYVRTRLPGVRVATPEATYLAWLDCRNAGAAAAADPFTFFLERARVALNDGALFGPGGAGFVRLNFGCPRSLLVEALDRMRAALTDDRPARV